MALLPVTPEDEEESTLYQSDNPTLDPHHRTVQPLELPGGHARSGFMESLLTGCGFGE